MKMLRFLYILFLSLVLMIITSCQKQGEKQSETKKLTVVTTLFPLYDFAKNISGENVDLFLLMPPGIEPHGFEPRPEDIMRINRADIFIYTGKHMEVWAEKILNSVDNKSLVIVDSSKGIKFIRSAEALDDMNNHKHDHAYGIDPHVWLDFENAKKMVDNIVQGFIMADPANKAIYIRNAEKYKSSITELDDKFRKALASCKTRYIIHGGHYAFNYMSKRYGFNYISAYHGLSPDAEPSPQSLVELMKKMKKYNTKYIFYEELVSPRIAEMIARETGAELLKIHAAHNLTRDEWHEGATFIKLMEKTLESLKIGLQCQ